MWAMVIHASALAVFFPNPLTSGGIGPVSRE